MKKKNEERQLGISEVEREGNEIEIVKTLWQSWLEKCRKLPDHANSPFEVEFIVSIYVALCRNAYFLAKSTEKQMVEFIRLLSVRWEKNTKV